MKIERFEINDNGGVPFIVEVNHEEKTATVTPEGTSRWPEGSGPFRFSFERVFVPDGVTISTPDGSPQDALGLRGNTLLFDVGEGYYIWVGNGGGDGQILSFKSRYPIEVFHSPVGNSNVPYPYAVVPGVGIPVLFVYLMLEGVALCGEDGDPYRAWWVEGARGFYFKRFDLLNQGPGQLVWPSRGA